MEYYNYSTKTLQDILDNVEKIKKILEKRKKTISEFKKNDVFVQNDEKGITLYKIIEEPTNCWINTKEISLSPNETFCSDEDTAGCDSIYLSKLEKISNPELFDIIWSLILEKNKQVEIIENALYTKVMELFNKNI